MPNVLDISPMPRHQQTIFIIWDSDDSIADSFEKCKQYIEALVNQLKHHAQYNRRVAFTLCLIEYQDTYIWGQTDISALDSDESLPFYTLPSVDKHEYSVWDTISKMISNIAQNGLFSGLSPFLPIFIYFVNKNEHFNLTKYGEATLLENPYYLQSIHDCRRLILCADSIWDLHYQADRYDVPYDGDLIFPYHLFNHEVIDYFMQIPQKMYQSGELASDLFALHQTNTSVVKLRSTPENSVVQAELPIECEW